MTTMTMEPGRLRWLGWAAALRAWLFLGFLALFFEAWARIAYGTSFFGNGFNLQSIAVARKLLTILNAIIRDQKPWKPA